MSSCRATDAKALADAARTAGPLAETGWNALVAGCYAHGIADAVGAALFAIAATVLFCLARKLHRSGSGNDGDAVCAVAGAVLVIISIMVAHDAIPKLAVPEGCAAHEIVSGGK